MDCKIDSQMKLETRFPQSRRVNYRIKIVETLTTQFMCVMNIRIYIMTFTL